MFCHYASCMSTISSPTSCFDSWYLPTIHKHTHILQLLSAGADLGMRLLAERDDKRRTPLDLVDTLPAK
jgi:hypothetical protein